MKKQILLGAFLLGALFTAKAQNTCDTALPLPIGTTTVGEINGTYNNGCWETQAAQPNGEWYMYTATANGMLRINTNLPANQTANDDTDDTRVSVFTGTCDALECYNGSDDISDTNYLTDFETPVAAGTTYYIQFDDRWQSISFDVEVTFTEVSCFPVSNFVFVEIPGETNPTFTTATIGWDAPSIGTATGYEVEYGPAGFTQGSGTTVMVTDMQVELTALVAGTDYAFYVRTDCGGGDFSDWVGPISFTTPFDPATPPYAYGFESANGGGWTTAGTSWGVYANGDGPVLSQEGESFAGAVGAGTASNSWLFSRDLNLTAGETVTVTYYVRKFVFEGTGNVNNLEVTYGTDNTAAAQATVINTHNDFQSETYVMQTAAFIVPADGMYNIGFHYTAPAHDTQFDIGGLLLDNISIESELGTNNVLATQFSVFPNPTTGVINIANAENILVNGVEIVDINGRTVKSVKFDNVSEAQINISDLASGMYLMNISSDKGTTTKKIVKN